MRDWHGLVALVLALGVTIALVAGFITAELTPGAVTTEEISLLSTIAGAAVGAVATYLGVRSPPRPDPPEPTSTDPPKGANPE
jgi:predicted anti-sigma-YlaC factor YlaD